MKRTYTMVGRNEATHEQIDNAILTLDWIDAKGKLPMGQGMAIQECITECKMPNPSHVAIHGRINGTSPESPYGFYGIRSKYKNGVAQVYLMDHGSECIVMASDFKEA